MMEQTGKVDFLATLMRSHICQIAQNCNCVKKSKVKVFQKILKSQVCGKVKISSLWESFCSVCRLIALRFLRGKVSKFPAGNGKRTICKKKKLGKYINFCRIHSHFVFVFSFIFVFMMNDLRLSLLRPPKIA